MKISRGGAHLSASHVFRHFYQESRNREGRDDGNDEGDDDRNASFHRFLYITHVRLDPFIQHVRRTKGIIFSL